MTKIHEAVARFNKLLEFRRPPSPDEDSYGVVMREPWMDDHKTSGGTPTERYYYMSDVDASTKTKLDRLQKTLEKVVNTERSFHSEIMVQAMSGRQARQVADYLSYYETFRELAAAAKEFPWGR